MKKIKILRQVLGIIVLTLMILITNVSSVNATLQANPETHGKKVDKSTNFIRTIREMEKTGQAMGLNETLKADLTSESDSNNIDVHMMKSTEYGAIGILSASGYGNPQILQESEIKTTTGNNTGIYLGDVSEWVAGGNGNNNYSNINSRYYNSYNAIYQNAVSEAVMVGDALGGATGDKPGCYGWHKASLNPYGSPATYLRRGGQQQIFYFAMSGDGIDGGSWFFGRGVAVCGEGF